MTAREDLMSVGSIIPFRWPRTIKVGDRYRKDFGNLVALARSINARGGLIHPISITLDDELIAGERRLRAWQLPECRFHKDPIPVTVLDIDSILAGEADENDPELRKPFAPSEAVAIARALRPRIEAEAKERQREHGGTAPGRVASTEHSGQVATSVEGGSHESPLRTRDRVARLVGKGARTLEKAEAVVAAAEADPEKFGNLVEAMDRTGRVNGPFRRLQNIKSSERICSEPAGLPMYGPYRTGIVDVPWASEPDDDGKDHGARGYYPYPTMTAATCAANFNVSSILQDSASVWLWITNYHLLRGDHLTIAQAWGLKPVTLLTWVKRKWGQGQRARGATEHVVQLIRGEIPCLGFDQKTWFEGDGGVHSQKPRVIYEIVEKLTPAPRYFELFARGGPRENWDMHGNEVGKLAPDAPRDSVSSPD